MTNGQVHKISVSCSVHSWNYNSSNVIVTWRFKAANHFIPMFPVASAFCFVLPIVNATIVWETCFKLGGKCFWEGVSGILARNEEAEESIVFCTGVIVEDSGNAPNYGEQYDSCEPNADVFKLTFYGFPGVN